jgi:hypothetical protein
MLKLFDLVPSWVYAAAIVLLSVALGLAVLDASSVRRNLAEFKAEVAENTRIAETQARERERSMQQQVEKINADAAKRQRILEERVAGASAALGGLRDNLAALNAGAAPSDPESAAYFEQARTARELLGTCAGRYEGVARAADELREQVIGLQGFATNVCKAGE